MMDANHPAMAHIKIETRILINHASPPFFFIILFYNNFIYNFRKKFYLWDTPCFCSIAL